MRRLQLGTGAMLGGTIVYFADSRRGRGRRAAAASKLRSRVRGIRRTREQKRHLRDERRRGKRLEEAGAGRFRPADDIAVATHLHQQLRGLEAETRDVTVEVVDGLVRVRGQVATTADVGAVLAAIAGQPGVRHVENLLHLPGEVAPNKAAAVAASHPH